MPMIPAKQWVPAVIGSCVISGVFWHLTKNVKIFGGETPRTLTKEWQEATDKMMSSMPREGGPNVIVNPIKRQNYR
ncbi:hypothetical protein CBR_g18720 [Chara braunii]|uniref:Uncharacterized protein n=1 Tax=Chara braunii TaxID=69332 RepID=A0A388KW73_CHABU|nr:hypothetical protein CBR_g18720 [Chara braunii]|eukprot:GBG74309.1 hypothetical protein CBR_g18720 [Chara braunii]